MVTQVKLRIDRGKLRAVVGPQVKSGVKRAAATTEKRVRANIIQADRFGRGDMLSGVQQREIPGDPMYPKIAVGSDVKHVGFQEFGTRAHGPVRARVLAFRPFGSPRTIFAKWVRGVRPARFMRRALDSLRPTDFTDG